MQNNSSSIEEKILFEFMYFPFIIKNMNDINILVSILYMDME